MNSLLIDSSVGRTIAVVTPVFKHSGLVSEAIESVLEQENSSEILHVLVNDGCPFAETHDTCQAYAATFPESILYLNKPNGGLSSARNFAIRHLLALDTRIRAVYFLDADNRLEAGAISRASAFMKSEGVDWVYPDVDMFGVSSGWDYGGDFSSLLMREFNFCEAGSLISMSVFESGILFDETMKQGYEDWDFFISAGKAGFVGRHLENFGLRYRKRPESMLADSTRSDANIRDSMQKKHASYFSLKEMLSLEQLEFPRYAIFLADEGRYVYTGDPSILDDNEKRDFVRDFWGARSDPGRLKCPPLLVVTTRACLEILTKLKMTNWAFWMMENGLSTGPMSLLKLQPGKDRGYNVATRIRDTAVDAAIVMTSFELLERAVKDTDTSWLDSFLTKSAWQMDSTELQVEAAMLNDGLCPDTRFDFLSQVYAVRSSPYSAISKVNWGWRKTLFRRVDAFRINRKKLNGATCFPVPAFNRPNVGFLLPLVEFGGVEKVALQLARVLKKLGWGVHLYVTERNTAQITTEWQAVFDTVSFVMDSTQNPWSGPDHYFGTPIADWRDDQNKQRAVGMMAWLDVVINCHASSANWLMGSLRRKGIVTVASLHLNDMSAYKRPLGHPFLTLGFEHAYDLIITCSHQMADWCRAMGFPAEKVVPVCNAPTLFISDAEIDAISDERLKTKNRDKVRALYIGRLDPQKGLDKLNYIVSECVAQKKAIDWSIVGKSVLKGPSEPELKALAPFQKPAVYTQKDLIEAYREADLLLLVSEYEGLPLVMLEAMLAGVAVIATNVGAISEVIVDGYNGFLVDNNGNVEAQIIAILDRLIADRDLLNTVSANAIKSARTRNWDDAADEMVVKINAQLSFGREKMQAA